MRQNAKSPPKGRAEISFKFNALFGCGGTQPAWPALQFHEHNAKAKPMKSEKKFRKDTAFFSLVC
jgi:hypothetical protein